MADRPETADRPPIVRIAHRAGNDRALLLDAVASGVDFIEADLQLSGSAIVARHERSVGRSPLLYERWRLRLDLRPLRLEEIAEVAANRGVRVLADLKCGRPGFAERVVATLAAHGSAGAILTGHHWGELAQARRTTGVSAYPSVPSEHALSRFISLLDTTGEGTFDGVAIGHWVVTADVVAQLRGRGLRTMAWTVDSRERAKELTALAIDGVISNSLALLAGLGGAAAGGPDSGGVLAHP